MRLISIEIQADSRVGQITYQCAGADLPAGCIQLTKQDGVLHCLAQNGKIVTMRIEKIHVGMVTQISYSNDAWRVVDEIRQVENGQLHCRRSWHNLSGVSQQAALLFELYRIEPLTAYLIPAVNYNGNFWGAGKEPKRLNDNDTPGTPAWVFGGDRTSIPACTITSSGGWVVGLYTNAALANQSGCSIINSENGSTQQVWWPLQEQPRTYIGRDIYEPGIEDQVEIPSEGSLHREVFITLQPAEDGPFDYREFFSLVWRQSYQPLPARFTPRELWRLGIHFAKKSLWFDTPDFRGFMLGRLLVEGEWVPATWNLAEIGWCGQNATYAAMMLQDFIWNQDEDSWLRGETALDFWVEKCALANGLFFTHIDDVLAGRLDARLETCNLGGGAYAYLLAADLAELAGRPKPSWRKMGLDLCDFFVRNALSDGRFGRYWNARGQLLEADGTVGSWIVWPLVKAYQTTGQEKYLRCAQRSFAAYCEQDLAKFMITAGALDTDCIDKEGAFPLLIAGLDLFDLTGDPTYLRQAEQAAMYLSTWQWHYDLSYPTGSAAAQVGYETFGGTSVSVQHHHLDPWGALIALGWLRLGKRTADPQWVQRAKAAWRQSGCGVSDGSLSIDGIIRPAGGQDEGFYHTRWGRIIGGVSNWLVAWPGAFRLFVLQQWPDWSDLE